MRKFSIAAIALTVLLLIAAVRFTDLRWSRSETLKAAESRAVNQAVIMSAYLAETFAAGDASLRQLALRSQRIGGPLAPSAEWAASLVFAKAGLTSIGAITVVDRDGIIRHSTRPEIVGASRSREPLYTAAMSGSGDELLVGTPVMTVAGPEPRRFVIPIGRRLTTAAGKVEGLVVASFIPQAAEGFFKAVDVGDHGAIWVFHQKGVLLFREPAAATAVQDARLNPIFAAAASHGGSGTLHATIEPGGPVFVSAYHTSTDPALITAVSLDRSEVLSDWTHEAIASTGALAVLTVLLGLGLFILFRQMDAKAHAELELSRTQELEAARLREANDRLAAALEREQSARQEAEAASRLKDQFLMTVSHELRTPLTAITGWARMLVDGAVSERQRDGALRAIDRNAQAQVRLIDDLLDVSRVMSGKLRLDVRPVSIETVVRDAITTVEPAAEAKSIRIESAVDPAAGRLMGDAERLHQILWNLLSNAVKFTPRGGRVTVTVVRTDAEIELVVRDTGIGIGAAFLPHVFERFRQQDGGTTRRYGGLGLGLAIVRSLVELHGGSVTAHSDGEGKGSSFAVRLPATAPVATPPEPLPAAASAASTAGQLRGVRILLVDDDASARDLFSAILDIAGATVTLAESADAAVVALRAAPYDVMVSDIEMPGVDGYRLVRDALVIARRRGERLGTIAVTAHSRQEDEARSLDAGFHLHLRKPVEPAALVAAVLSVCEHRDRPAAAEEPSGY